MKKFGVSFKTFSLVALFSLCTILQLTHGIIAVVNSLAPKNHAAKEKSVDKGNLPTPSFKKEIPFLQTADKGLITGNPFRN